MIWNFIIGGLLLFMSLQLWTWPKDVPQSIRRILSVILMIWASCYFLPLAVSFVIGTLATIVIVAIFFLFCRMLV